MKRILILATPRTGSNLLLDSLASHPQAVTGGEILAANALTRNSPAAIDNLANGRECNLFKVHWADRFKLDWRLLDNSLAVHLYRRDTEAQIRSWKKASETGRWCKWDVNPEPSKFPMNAYSQIAESRIGWSVHADIAIAYESLIANWDAIVGFLLAMAGWELAELAMVHSTTASLEATEHARREAC